MVKSIGIDIGGTNFRVGVFEDTKLIDENRFQANFSTIFKQNNPDHAWETVVTHMVEGIESVLQQYDEIQHIGIGFPGFIDPQTKSISESPNLPGLKNVQLVEALMSRLNKQHQIKHIHLENDALAAAYGEYCARQSDTSSLLYFGLGTGVGGGLIICGTPYTGINGMAMELGHIIIHPGGRPCGCGNQGCVEQYASATAIEMSYFETSQQHATAQAIAEKARNHDVAATNAFILAGESLAVAAAHALKVLDIPTVVIGGGLSQSWDLMENSFHKTLEANLIPVLRGKITVLTSTLDDTAGMLGAAQLALRPRH